MHVSADLLLFIDRQRLPDFDQIVHGSHVMHFPHCPN